MKHFFKKISILYVFLCITFIIILSGIYLSLGSKGDYLTSLDYFNDKYNWAVAVWIGVLAIHGTLAALSITFMGAFINISSEFNLIEFRGIVRKVILKKCRFLGFSLYSGLSLVVGVVFITIGGGLGHYFLSILSSIIFILLYIHTYYLLYNISENQDVTYKMLLDLIERESSIRNKILKKKENNKGNFLISASKLDNIKIRADGRGWLKYNTIQLDDSFVIDDFSEKKLISLSNYIKKKNSASILYINVDYLMDKNPMVLFFIDNKVDSLDVDVIYSKVKRVFYSTKINLILTDISEKFIDCICKSIISGSSDINYLNGVYKSLIKNNHEGHLIKKINNKILLQEIKPNINHLINNYINMLYISQEVGDEKNTIEIYKSILVIPAEIYSEQIAIDSFKKNKEFIEYYTKSGSVEYMDIYCDFLIASAINKRYEILLNTMDFILNDSDYANSMTNLSEEQKVILEWIHEQISLLILRFIYISNHEASLNYSNELDKIKETMNYIIRGDVFKYLYYIQGTYEILFRSHNNFRNLDSNKILNNIDWDIIDMNEELYFSMATLMLLLLNEKTRLDILFVSDYDNFLENTGIKTSSITRFENTIRTSYFTSFISSFFSDSELLNKKLDNLSQEVIKINTILRSKIFNEVKNSKIDDSIFEEYSNEVKYKVKEIIDGIINTGNSSGFINNDLVVFKENINKRVFIQPIDGVFYDKNTSATVSNSINYFVNYIFNLIDVYDIRVIDSPDRHVLKKYITVIYGEVTANLSANLTNYVIRDKNKILPLEKDGYYYLSVMDNFDVIKSGELIEVTLLDDMIIKDQDISLELSIVFNVDLKLKNKECVIYYSEK